MTKETILIALILVALAPVVQAQPQNETEDWGDNTNQNDTGLNDSLSGPSCFLSDPPICDSYSDDWTENENSTEH